MFAHTAIQYGLLLLICVAQMVLNKEARKLMKESISILIRLDMVYMAIISNDVLIIIHHLAYIVVV